MEKILVKSIPILAACILSACNTDDIQQTAHTPENTGDEIVNTGESGIFFYTDGTDKTLHEGRYEVKDGLAIFEGDIILGSAEEMESSDRVMPQGFAPNSQGTRWPSAIIPYEFASSLTSSHRSMLNSAMEHWESNTRFRFVQHTPANDSQYPIYVVMRTADLTVCGRATIGYRESGLLPSLELDHDCASTDTAIHEIGHVTGLFHEHTRPDRDNYIFVSSSLQDKYGYEKRSGGLIHGPYDYNSIMHYSRINGSTKIFLALEEKQQRDIIYAHPDCDTSTERLINYEFCYIEPIYLGGNVLSPQDKKMINKMYLPVAGDYDNIGKANPVLVRNTNNYSWTWLIRKGSSTYTKTWGLNTDIPVPGDYDRDGKTDIAVWRGSTGAWWIIQSSNNASVAKVWGQAGDKPIPGDYDGDGKSDTVVIRNNSYSKQWRIKYSADNSTRYRTWGLASDIEVPGDYDGDGATDIAVWRLSTQQWFHIRSSDGQTVGPPFGAAGDLPVPGDYDGDGKTDYAVADQHSDDSIVWKIRRSSNNAVVETFFGSPSDTPAPGDYDGDGKTDIAQWTSNRNLKYISSSNGNTVTIQAGQNGDVPVSPHFISRW